jgi:YaiO family outer membrane protein
MKGFLVGTAVLVLTLAPAAAASAAGKAAGLSFAITAEHSSYTEGLGYKSLITASARLPLGEGTSLILGAGSGERRVGGDTLRARGFSAGLSHRIAPGVTSRTELTGGKAGPLFARLMVGEQLAFRFRGTEVGVGGRLSRYAGGHQVRSFHVGIDQRVGSVRLDYDLAAYEQTSTMPRGLVHRLGAGLEDRNGLTEVQLGTGGSLHEHDWRPDKVAGSFQSIALKRKQKLMRGLAVEIGTGWTGFERPKGRYGAGKVSAGLVLSR